MQRQAYGILDKMSVELSDNKATYSFTTLNMDGEHAEVHIPLSSLVGKKIKLVYLKRIVCQNCFKETKKSYGGGFCYPCSIKLAACDMCILRPSDCHYRFGTCREPDWADKNCNVDHIVYLANSSGLKVGITRATQVPIRFMDQGAVEALPILRVKSRYHSGVIEKLISSEIADKTDWRKMLKGETSHIDLEEKRDELLEIFGEDLDRMESELATSFEFLEKESVIEIGYPVNRYPEKVTSLSFDKTAEIEGILEGIKGQYLILDCGVINLRNHTSYVVELYA